MSGDTGAHRHPRRGRARQISDGSSPSAYVLHSNMLMGSELRYFDNLLEQESISLCRWSCRY